MNTTQKILKIVSFIACVFVANLLLFPPGQQTANCQVKVKAVAAPKKQRKLFLPVSQQTTIEYKREPFAYPHSAIYKNITFGTAWRDTAEGFISNPYLLVILSPAAYTEPLESYCKLTKVQYKNGTIEENYTGSQAARFFRIFDLDLDFPGALRIWVVNAQDAGLIYSTVDKSKCENIDFTWRNTPDSMAM